MSSPLIRLVAIEPVAGRQSSLPSADVVERPLPPLLARFDLDRTVLRGNYNQLIAFLEAELIHQRLWQSDGEAVVPFGDDHRMLRVACAIS
jgi:hypothetical protein